MLVDLVGQLKRRYLATAFSSLVGSLTSCGVQTDTWMKERSQKQPGKPSSAIIEIKLWPLLKYK